MFLFGSRGKFIFNKFPLKSLLLPHWKKNWIEIKTLVDVLVGLNSESNSNCLCAQLWDWQEQFSGNEKSLSLSLSHLQLRARDEPCSPCSGHLPRLPPVVVVLADDLEDVPGVEGDPRLCAGDEIIVQGVVLELGSNKDVAGRRSRAVGGNDLR